MTQRAFKVGDKVRVPGTWGGASAFRPGKVAAVKRASKTAKRAHDIIKVKYTDQWGGSDHIYANYLRRAT